MSKMFKKMAENESIMNSRLSQAFSEDSVVVVHRKSPHEWMTYKQLLKFAEKHGHREIHHGVQWWAKAIQYDSNGIKNRDFGSVTWIIFDFDDKERIENARGDAIKLVNYYVKQFGEEVIESGSVRMYFSGNKGFHVILNPRAMFFGTMGDKQASLRELVGYYVGWVGALLKLKTVDSQIYRRDGTIRMVNTCRYDKFKIDGKMVDQYKIELSFDELKNMEMSEIRRMAKRPREELFPANNKFEIAINFQFIDHVYNILQGWLQLKNATPRKKTSLSLTDAEKGRLPVCIRSLHTMNLDGQRNKAVIAVACFMKDAGWDKKDALAYVRRLTEDISSHISASKLKERQVQGEASVIAIYDSDRYHFGCGSIQDVDGVKDGVQVKPSCLRDKCEFIESGSVDYKTPECMRASLYDVCFRAPDGKVETSVIVKDYSPKYQNVPTTATIKCPYHHKENPEATPHCTACRFQKEIRVAMSETKGKSSNIRYGKDGCMARTSLFDEDVVRLSNAKDGKREPIMAKSLYVHSECKEYSARPSDYGRLFTFYGSSDLEFDRTLELDMVLQGKKLEVKEQVFMMVIRKGREQMIYGNSELPEMKFGDALKLVVKPMEQMYGDLVLLVESLERSDSDLDRFVVDEAVTEELKLLQTMNDPESPKSLLRMASTIERASGIFYRPFTAISIAVAFHSTFALSLPKIIGGRLFHTEVDDEEKTEKGMIDMLLLGDPGQGKTTLLRRLMDFWGMGDLVNGPNASIAGMIGGVRTEGTPFIRWGIMPRSHKKIIAIDEFNNMHEQIVRALTFVRSEGIARIEKVESGQTHARVRLITMANVKANDDRDISDLSSYDNGVEAVKDLVKNPQDIRRFDMIVINRKGDKESEIPLSNVYEKDTYPKSLARTLLLWCWTRKSNEVIWERDAVILLESYYLHMQESLNCDIPLAEQHILRNRIGRIAQAMAGMTISTDQTYENIIVKERHVTWASSLLWHMLCHNNAANLHRYAWDYQRVQYMSPDDVDWLEETLSGFEQRAVLDPATSASGAFVRDRFMSMVRSGQFTKKNMQEELEMDDDLFREFFSGLRDRVMIKVKRTGGTSYYKPSPKINRHVRELDQDELDLVAMKDTGDLTSLLVDEMDEEKLEEEDEIVIIPKKPPGILSILKDG